MASFTGHAHKPLAWDAFGGIADCDFRDNRVKHDFINIEQQTDSYFDEADMNS
ncbi:MAG: hypothetical protein P4K80_00925 [Acidobacteriaceae bacterium]|nr:hypothetical protein [Acidobacteriaceae bacterium]